MYYQKRNIVSGEQYDEPRLLWEMKDKLAIIGYLLMSVDSDDDENRVQKLEGFADAETLQTIATECDAFLATVADNERYDLVAREVVAFIEGEPGQQEQDCWDELADKAIECVDVALSGIADALESFARRLG